MSGVEGKISNTIFNSQDSISTPDFTAPGSVKSLAPPRLFALDQRHRIMFCTNCHSIFRGAMTYRPWNACGGEDAEAKDTWTAYHKYEIPYQDLSIAATKCHCCHYILQDSKDRHHPTVPAEQDLHVSMKIEFDEDGIGVGWGTLKVSVKFYDDDDDCYSYDESYSDDDNYIDDYSYSDDNYNDNDIYNDNDNYREDEDPDKDIYNDNDNYSEEEDPFFADIMFSISRRDDPVLSERSQGEHPWFGDSHMVPTTSHVPMNNTGSEYTAEFVKRCLEHCKSHHRNCQPDSTGARWYPTRLIEVLEESTFRVIETSETVPTGPYATLSHCWGESRIITATTNNISSLKKHIPLLDLPKTFSDALQFIRAIGISFIWIDSLCIIQDSVKDWEYESRTMLQVYRHAECNLAAAISENSHGGLFSERNHAILPTGWFEIENNIPRLKGAYCAVPYGHVGSSYFKHAFEEQIGSSRLISRGWVFQERAASRRIIAFGRDHVFWDCAGGLESDVLPSHRINLYHYSDEENRVGSGSRVMGMAVPKVLSPGVPKSFYSLEEALLAWQFIMKRYSACDFTFNKDKPVAILGVARMMSDALKAQPTGISTAYWAGLWLQDMYRQLAWRVGRTGLHKNRHAPSWSWLSIDGPVEGVWSPDLDPESSGRWVSAVATVVSPGDETMISNSSFCNISSDLRIWCNLYLLDVTEPLAAASSAAEKPYTSLVYLDSDDIGTDRLHFLPLTYNDEVFINPHGLFNGILLQPEDNRPGVYRRCGSAKLSLRKTTLKLSRKRMKDFSNKLRSKKNGTGRRILRQLGKVPSPVDFTYEKYDAKMGYLIRII